MPYKNSLVVELASPKSYENGGSVTAVAFENVTPLCDGPALPYGWLIPYPATAPPNTVVQIGDLATTK
jgi:hypothetical protein